MITQGLYIKFIRSSLAEVFLKKGVLKICSKFTGEHPCRNVISIKLLCNFIEITLWHGCSVNFLHIFRTPFTKTPLDGCFYEICFSLLVFTFFNFWDFFLSSIRIFTFDRAKNNFPFCYICLHEPLNYKIQKKGT